jgi:hypothetical protein
MSRASLTIALISFISSAVGAASAQEAAPTPKPILPGYWSYTASTILPGASVGKQCVRPDKIDEFMSGPHNRHYHCTYPNKRVGDGQAMFDGECIGKHGEQYKITVAGAYGPKQFTLKGHIKGIILGLPLNLPIAIDAKWIADECPAQAK